MREYRLPLDTSEGTMPSAAPPLGSTKAIAPAVVDLLSMTGIMAFEGIILGRFSSAALAGGGMGLNILFFFFTVFLTFVLGAALPISRYLGVGRIRDADRAFSNAMGATAALATVFAVVSILSARFIFGTVFGATGEVEKAAVDYFTVLALVMPIVALNFTGTGILRATGDAVASMTVNLTANLIHAGLAVILVWGLDSPAIPAMGPKGAALALGIAQAIGLIIQLRLIAGGRTRIRLHIADILRPRWTRLIRMIKTGLPATLEQLIWMSGQIVLLVYITRLGEAELAAHQIVIRLTQTLGVVYQGYAFGNMALCGHKIGAGDREGASRLSRNIRYLSLLTGAIIGTVVFIFGESIARMFTVDPAVLRIAVMLMPLLALQQLPKSQTMITTSELRARGDLLFIVITGAFFVALNEVALSAIGIFFLKWGLSSVWALLILDEIYRFVAHIERLNKGLVKEV